MRLDYDEELILKGAEGFYRQARAIVVKHALTGAALGTLAGFLASLAWDATNSPNALVISAIALVGLWLGISSGRARAFALRFQAQQLLCQVQIERNTRALLEHLSSSGHG